MTPTPEPTAPTNPCHPTLAVPTSPLGAGPARDAEEAPNSKRTSPVQVEDQGAPAEVLGLAFAATGERGAADPLLTAADDPDVDEGEAFQTVEAVGSSIRPDPDEDPSHPEPCPSMTPTPEPTTPTNPCHPTPAVPTSPLGAAPVGDAGAASHSGRTPQAEVEDPGPPAEVLGLALVADGDQGAADLVPTAADDPDVDEVEAFRSVEAVESSICPDPDEAYAAAANLTPPSAFSALPNDVLVLVADFLQSPSLSAVNRAALSLLTWRHACLGCGADQWDWLSPLDSAAVRSLAVSQLGGNAVTLARILTEAEHLCRISAKFRHAAAVEVEDFLDLLSMKRNLQSVALNFAAFVSCAPPKEDAECRRAEVVRILDVGAYPMAVPVADLHLDVSDNRLHASSFLGLAHLRFCAALRHLTLRLGNNRLDAPVLDVIGQLAEAPALRSLTLDLSSAQLVGGYSAGLSALALSTTLHTIHLNLSNNLLGSRCRFIHAAAVGLNRDAEALGHLGNCVALRRLTLNLSLNHFGPGDMPALLPLRHAPSLCHLHLDLSFNALMPEDVAQLARLREAANLQSLHLALRGSQLVTGAAQPLAQLALAPRLDTLGLVLADNMLGPRDAKALLALQDSPTLHSLRLDLSRNWLRAADMALLEALRRAPRLRRVTLDFFANQPGHGAVPYNAPTDVWERCASARSQVLAKARREAAAEGQLGFCQIDLD
eukprot:EG_transcript_2047